MTRVRCVSVLSLMMVCSFARPAAAQPLGRLAVVPLGTPEVALPSRVAARLEAVLAEQRATPLSLHEARDRFVVRSRAPQSPSESDVDALARAAQDAVEHVAFGRVSAAQKSVREVIQRAERTLESLNRETATARSILDACLSLVRSTLATEKREAALEQAMRCRRLVPDLVPSEKAHPANVIGVLAEADDLLRRMRIGRLTVKSAPDSGCAVYVNGRHLGTTPFELDRAAAGDYRVQVECAPRPGRVHLVQLGDEPVELVVDTTLDRAVTSEPRLALRYESEAAAHEHAVAHAASIGRELEVDDVLLVQADGVQATLLRVRVMQRRLVGSAIVPLQGQRASPGALEAAVAALAEARLRAAWDGSAERWAAAQDGTAPLARATREAEIGAADPGKGRKSEEGGATGAAGVSAPSDPPHGDRTALALGSNDSAQAPDEAPAAATSPPDSDAPKAEGGRGRKLRVGGAIALALGVATLGASYGLSVRRHQRSETLRAGVRWDGQTYPGNVDAWEAARALPYVFAAAGTAVASAGVAALVLSASEPLPRWSAIASAVAAAGLIGWGTYDVVRGGGCAAGEFDRRLCAPAREQRDRGALVLLSSAPLLTLALVPLARQGRAPGAQVTLAPIVERGLIASSLRLTFVDVEALLRMRTAP